MIINPSCQNTYQLQVWDATDRANSYIQAVLLRGIVFSPPVTILPDCEQLPDGLAVVMGSQQSVWNTSLIVGSPAAYDSVALCGGTIYTAPSTP